MLNKRKGKDEIISRLLEKQLKLATVSGVLTTRPGIISEVDTRLTSVEVITTKSYQVVPNTGNCEPVIVETAPGNFGNAVGLRNPGMLQGLKELRDLRNTHMFRALLNVSISGSTPEEFVLLAEAFSEVADILELNLSCPHAAPGYGMSIGTDPQLVSDYIRTVRQKTDRPLIPKLTPNVDNIGEIALAAVEAGADGICAINTVGPELYIESHSGKPILINSRGNRGGKSGSWIREIAREKVAEIRLAIGPDIPIIGIGGVSSGRDVMELTRAGANLVGLGSVFARVKPEHWEAYTEALLKDAGEGTNEATSYIVNERLMEYKPYSVMKNTRGGHGTAVLELEGELEYASSQFAFLWLPEVGEKPFSIARAEPLTFFIKNRGRVSKALCELKEGETVYVRGVYGRSAPITASPHAYILAGGTGIAVARKLVKELSAAGTVSTIYYATCHADDVLVPPGLKDICDLKIIPDNGVPARAILEWEKEIKRKNLEQEPVLSSRSRYWQESEKEQQTMEDRRGRFYLYRPEPSGGYPKHTEGEENDRGWALYTIGPPDFMRRAVEAAESLGKRGDDIYLSVETATHCGVGLCGECECGGRLTCQEGTFFTKEFLDRKGIGIADLPGHNCVSTNGDNRQDSSLLVKGLTE